MTIAHLAGVPFEEWLVPLAAMGSGIAIVLRAAFGRLGRRARPAEGRDGHHRGMPTPGRAYRASQAPPQFANGKR